MTTAADQRTDRDVLTITESALEKILELRFGEADAENLGLRIEITGVRGVDYTYDLAFELLEERDKDDVVLSVGMPVLVPSGDVERLVGSVLDLPSNPSQGGLVLRNPNRPPVAEPEELELTGDVPDQIRQLIDQVINPAIAAHGGVAEFVGLDGGTVYVRLGGGCQGCAMSKATVAAGIEQTLQDHLEGITGVVDVTDHESGENPYYGT